LELAVLPLVAERTRGPPVGNRLSRPQWWLMQGGCRCLTLVGDAGRSSNEVQIRYRKRWSHPDEAAEVDE
jgi:hypothetical protein